MKNNYTYYLVLFISLFLSPLTLFSQKDQIPLETALEQNSERQLIKIGMITASKPAKIKFGAYHSDNRKGASEAKDENGKALLFSFDLFNQEGNKASIEGATNLESNDTNPRNDVSIYISTDIDEEDLWVLLMIKTPETNEFSLKNTFLTNGSDEITFQTATGEPTGKSEVTAPKGITAYINGNPLGAMQYYSGGSFSYKKFIWVSDSMDQQLQFVTAAVFSAMLEVGDYFIDTQFTD
ncbi:hypothetical protein [Lutimonas sp.]|uniref:hypothetical protein n=1 Tax=Lutimonas sp. TaxID=1872403 RepID=UPI003D9B16A6